MPLADTRRTSSPPRIGTRPAWSRWIRLAASGIHGRGVYARRPIPEGTRVIEYTGERITKAESRRREARRLARRERGDDGCVYIFELNQRHDIDGSTRRNVARWINHACDPNCTVEIIRGRIWIIARRDIPAGEELSYDYGFPLREWRDHPCRCGSPGCPGFIVESAQRWRLRRMQRKARTKSGLARRREGRAKEARRALDN